MTKDRDECLLCYDPESITLSLNYVLLFLWINHLFAQDTWTEEW